MAGLLGNYAVKFIYVFLLAYLLSKSVKVSIVTTVVIVIGIFILKKFGNNENFDGSDISGSDISGSKLIQEIEVEEDVELPQEPVVDREQAIKPVKQVSVEGKVPIAADLLTNVHADAEHVDTLKPLVSDEKKEIVGATETDVIDVCGSRLNKNGYTGFDQSPDNFASL
jgi:hypothetical protein